MQSRDYTQNAIPPTSTFFLTLHEKELSTTDVVELVCPESLLPAASRRITSLLPDLCTFDGHSARVWKISGANRVPAYVPNHVPTLLSPKPRISRSFQVFEFVDTDLYKLIGSPQFLTDEHIKLFMYQLLVGLKYIHSAHVIHRDMKVEYMFTTVRVSRLFGLKSGLK